MLNFDIKKIFSRASGFTKNVFGMLFLLTIILILPATLQAQTWQLVWHDEFLGDEIDLTKWSHEVNGQGGGNNELQYYTARDTNSFIENGNLVIQALQEQYTGPDGTRQYTSARMRTKFKGDWLYGRFEMRAKLPTDQGLWPAFWLLPTDWEYGGWAASGEIDVMETVGYSPNQVHGTIHYGGSWPNNVHSGGSKFLSSGTFSDDYHVFAMEWEPGEFRWYLDGEHYHTETSWFTTAASFPAPFDKRFHILLNVAVGGDWPGSPNATTTFPERMYVDYVRVFQDNNAAPSVAITHPANNATFNAGENLTIETEASDPDGSVSKVEFMQGDGVIGEAVSAPYNLPVNNLAAGSYTLRARVTDNNGLTSLSGDVNVVVGGGAEQSPYLMSAVRLPGRIEVENYDIGGEGVAYHDVDTGNNGGGFRNNEDVDIEATNDVGGGHNVGWIDAGEWMEYLVDVSSGGVYSLVARVAAPSASGIFSIEMNGTDVTGPIGVTNTGDWQNWASVTKNNINLTPGIHTLRFKVLNGGFNLNWIEFNAITSIDDETAALPAVYELSKNYPNPFNPSTRIEFRLPTADFVTLEVFAITGEKVATLVQEHKTAGKHSVQFDARELGSGVYMYRMITPNFQQSRKMLLVK